MRVLFVVSTPSGIEPLGVMLLSAICRRHGHETFLAVSRRPGALLTAAQRFNPDAVAYSMASADMDHLKDADRPLVEWLSQKRGRRVLRIMGGPHPTYCPEILDEMRLDAICQGDGDEALPEALRRWEAGESLDGIPNISLTSADAPLRHLVTDLDALPFPDRDLYYRAVPYARLSGLRSFHTGRGCPYKCTYCFNHVYNRKFGGLGPLLRRRSVGNVLEEIERVVAEQPPVRMLRFSDDVFVFRPDDWIREFVEEYPRRVGVPFYCLMRSNTFTEETAELLSRAGCRAVGMSIEAGGEHVRNAVLKRQLSNRDVEASFAVAKKFGIRTYASTLVGIPGTTLSDDFESLEFVRKVRPTAPLFSITSPYKGTIMWEEAVRDGHLPPDSSPDTHLFSGVTELNCFSPQDKRTHQRIFALGPLYANLPAPLHHVIMRLIRTRFPLPEQLLKSFGLAYYSYRLATRIFPQAIPRSPRAMLHAVMDNIRHL